MKAKLEFNLPEDQDKFTLATHADELWSVLFEVDQAMRSLLKYGELNDDTCQVVDELREKLYDEMDNHNISFGMVD